MLADQVITQTELLGIVSKRVLADVHRRAVRRSDIKVSLFWILLFFSALTLVKQHRDSGILHQSWVSHSMPILQMRSPIW